MSSWQAQMGRAASVDEVVAIVRDYFALWTPEEIALLPTPCQPGRLRDASQIEELNRNAVEAYRNTRATGQALELLQRLTGIVGRACVRIAQLRDASEPPVEARQNPGKSAAARGR
jgi:hypothetical protein